MFFVSIIFEMIVLLYIFYIEGADLSEIPSHLAKCPLRKRKNINRFKAKLTLFTLANVRE